MNSYLLSRSLGLSGPQALQRAETSRLLHALQSAPGVRFDGSQGGSSVQNIQGGNAGYNAPSDMWAHRAGVNCLAIDRFEGKYMLSGGAESSIMLWDLEQAEKSSKNFDHRPVAAAPKSLSHKFGITHISFYPFDCFAFLSSSYDHTLKIYATETVAISASFDLNSVVYSHALSPIADHLLVACATQHPAIRLVDLRSGASAHALAGHQGAVLSVAWSPRDEHILASGGADGTVRLWDIRRSAGSLGLLDLEDSTGIMGENGFGKNARARERGKAHIGACNGVVWTDDGDHLVSAGHDERVRVWDVATGANTLSHFGPVIKNTHLSTLLPLIVPSNMISPGKKVMFYPNEKEILMFDLFEGALLKRLRPPGVAVAQARGSSGQRNIRNRITALAWRGGDIQMYSAHSDGLIRAWMPRTKDEMDLDTEDEAEAAGDVNDDGTRRKKREALDEIYRDLTRQKITFT